jgi:holo-[acyl-carrier protein] synthase
VIVGIGLDLTEVPRIAAMLEKWGDKFARKIFTDGERAYALSRPNAALHLAARWSAKEAVLKALRVPTGLSWHEMEVLGGGREQPTLQLSGRAKQAADRLGIARLHLSLTHTDGVAAAVVIAETA